MIVLKFPAGDSPQHNVRGGGYGGSKPPAPAGSGVYAGNAIPSRLKLGFLPDVALAPSRLGVMSKSGTLSYEGTDEGS